MPTSPPPSSRTLVSPGRISSGPTSPSGRTRRRRPRQCQPFRGRPTGANLTGANLADANLAGADFTECICSGTLFANVDLSAVIGLDKARGAVRSEAGSASTRSFVHRVRSRGVSPRMRPFPREVLSQELYAQSSPRLDLPNCNTGSSTPGRKADPCSMDASSLTRGRLEVGRQAPRTSSSPKGSTSG